MLLLTVLLGVGLGGCAENPVERPEAVLGQFVELMERGNFDRRALRDAYGLLDHEATSRLAERAEQARTLSGGEYEPWEMLVPGRFHLNFSPADRGGMRSEITGDSAVVQVTGTDGEQARVPMVRERGRWRVALRVPALSSVSGFGRVSP